MICREACCHGEPVFPPSNSSHGTLQRCGWPVYGSKRRRWMDRPTTWPTAAAWRRRSLLDERWIDLDEQRLCRYGLQGLAVTGNISDLEPTAMGGGWRREEVPAQLHADHGGFVLADRPDSQQFAGREHDTAEGRRTLGLTILLPMAGTLFRRAAAERIVMHRKACGRLQRFRTATSSTALAPPPDRTRGHSHFIPGRRFGRRRLVVN